MRRWNPLVIIFALITICMSDIIAVNADISSWTDENGVKHYSNRKPPKKTRNVRKTDEIEHDPVEHMKWQKELETMGYINHQKGLLIKQAF